MFSSVPQTAGEAQFELAPGRSRRQIPSDDTFTLHVPGARKSFPIKSDDGYVTLWRWKGRWYDKKRRRIYEKWYIQLPAAAGGRRVARNSVKAIIAIGREYANTISNGQISLLSFSQAKKASVQRAEELLRPSGLSLELFAADGAAALAILRAAIGDFPTGALALAARFYADHHAKGVASRTCPEILQELLAARKTDGAAQNTLEDLASRLGRFAKDFTGPVLSIAGPDLNAWLRKLPVTRRTRNNYRGALVAFYRFAKDNHYVPRDWSAMDDVHRAKDEPIRIALFPADEFQRILAARESIEKGMADRGRPYKTMIPYLAIGAFAGLRHEEMCAGKDPNGKPLPVLDWRDVDLKRKRIHVREEVARKIGRDRFVPLSDNLIAWLKPYAEARPSGPICELANANNAFQRAARLAKVQWRDNGLRRTFISSRLALVENIGKVALEAGTSPERINKNYKKTVDAEEAAAWFAINPTRPDLDTLFAWGKRGSN
jgi:integrase